MHTAALHLKCVAFSWAGSFEQALLGFTVTLTAQCKLQIYKHNFHYQHLTHASQAYLHMYVCTNIQTCVNNILLSLSRSLPLCALSQRLSSCFFFFLQIGLFCHLGACFQFSMLSALKERAAKRRQ